MNIDINPAELRLLAEELAAEVDRLRAGHDALHLKCSNYVAEIGKLTTINAELVAALEQIMNPSAGYPRIAPGLNEIARAAIAKAKGQP
jgi:hypothetical protein